MKTVLETLRPRQWTKNLLLFAGVLFSRQLGNPALALRAGVGFAAFCLLSSAVYLVNDLKDVEADRRHATKRGRPVASGRLPTATARVIVAVLLTGAGAIAWWLGLDFLGVAAGYLALNLAYTFALKNHVLLDVFAIAIGFVLRAIAGVELLKPVSPQTELSPWLLVCSFFGALFLALAKRRRELANAGADAAHQRAVLGHYDGGLLDGLLMVTAAASLMAYALYTIWPGTVAKFGTEALLYTVPFVAYGIFRYLYLVRATEQAEDPSSMLLADRPLAACVLLYLIAVLAILYTR